jgi:hypothetical protein
MFCGLGRLGVGMFCNRDVLELGPFVLGRFVLGRFVLGCLVGAPCTMIRRHAGTAIRWYGGRMKDGMHDGTTLRLYGNKMVRR